VFAVTQVTTLLARELSGAGLSVTEQLVQARRVAAAAESP
jgi:hypothetical protein